MSEENANNVAGAANAVSEKIKGYADKGQEVAGKVDRLFDRLFQLIEKYPWESWLEKANGFIAKFVSPVVLFAGAMALILNVLKWFKYDHMTFGELMTSGVAVAVGAMFVSHLAPKALRLQQSFITKGDVDKVRPELLYILKVLLGVGCIVGGIVSALTFTSEGVGVGIALFVLGLIFSVLLGRPQVVSVEADYPKNTVEEVVSIFRMLIKSVLVFATMLTGVATFGWVIYGLVNVISNFRSPSVSSDYFMQAVLGPLVIPLAVYVLYLTVSFILDLYRAVVSIPAKLDKLTK